MDSIAQYVESRLKLRVNRRKSAVAPATRRPFLGFGFFSRDGEVKVRVDLDARTRAKDRLRRLTARNWGVSMERRIHSAVAGVTFTGPDLASPRPVRGRGSAYSARNRGSRSHESAEFA
jgi:hypothetical protein